MDKFFYSYIDISLCRMICYSTIKTTLKGYIMTNPWEEIHLFDYENHMRFNTVRQLQTLNKIMKNQFDTYSASTAIVLGVAGGNGLNHIDKKKYLKVYGVDINDKYLIEVKQRYLNLSDCLECIQLDLITECERLPEAELVIANLVIEYIGYNAFFHAISQVKPNYVSCVIQDDVNEKGWVSGSPYLHVFDRLNAVHNKIQDCELDKLMKNLEYQKCKKIIYPLPEGKSLIQIDFKKLHLTFHQ